ncbi:hypothetical protein AB835_06660 [Candidatus Endobugula sertula]|uniref:Peptidase M48 domain-containing protein n=1 Tax=Candidatus Endobugula sertula TaxID=62101 RepID=A0A1D2QQP4_9GAMM|nr:hypothetical protein AB835_06660 [Candidatus Endobugula sertula]
MTMNDVRQRYQLPDNTYGSIRTMSLYLTGFFLSLVISIVFIVIYAEKIVVYIPFSAEKKFIKPYETALRRWYRGKSYPEVDAYLQALANEMNTPLGLEAHYDINVHYVDSFEVNAFATLGGHIFVYRGLMELMPDENSLAMVLAYEIAHIQHRDPATAMGRWGALQLLYGFLSHRYTGKDNLGSLGGEIGMSFFSREQEKNADLAALDGLHQYYGHVSGYNTFFLQMLSGHDKQVDIPQWLSTHPDLQARIDYLQDRVDENRLPIRQTRPIPKNIINRIKSPIETQ